MTGQTVATVHWRALDHEGDDKCRLARASHGWLLIGHARFRDDSGFAALDYVVRCNTDWHTLGADISGVHGDASIRLRIERDADQWQINGTPQSRVTRAHDLDLSFTPATNLMPLRRLADHAEPWLRTDAAWLKYPQSVLKPLEQSYTRARATGMVDYVARQTRFSTQFQVDPSGFITLYPGLWQGEVQHAASP